MRHNPSVREGNEHFTLENRIGSVCSFSSYVFYKERVISLQPDLSPIWRARVFLLGSLSLIRRPQCECL